MRPGVSPAVGLVVFGVIGCVAHNPLSMSISKATYPLAAATCDESCIKGDRDAFITELNNRVKQNRDDEKGYSHLFGSWSAGGIAAGFLGGVAALTLHAQNDRKNAAAITSLGVGAIAAWLAVQKYDGNASTSAACAKTADNAKETFAATYSDANIPTTEATKNDYIKLRIALTDFVNKVCSG